MRRKGLEVVRRASGAGNRRMMLRAVRRGLREPAVGRIRWVEGDMRSFNLGESFGLALIPGHSFQNILTAEDQVATLEAIKRHLVAGGTLVVHVDHLSPRWLGDEVIDCWESGRLEFHCAFRFEMQHLLEGAGFVIEALYGDFGRQALADDSSEMVWVVRVP